MSNINKFSTITFLIVVMLSCGASSFQKKAPTQNQTMTIEQSKYYDDLWEKVDQFTKKNLPKSADKVVDTILMSAERERITMHWIKAIRYKVTNMAVLRDEGNKRAIAYTQVMLKKAWSPAGSFLRNILAGQYRQYAQNRMYKIGQLTQTGELSSDIDEWTLLDFSNEISRLYFEGLEDPNIKSAAIKDYELLLQNNQYNKTYRKTVYDVLAHQAIDYFVNSPFHITKPTDEFYLNDNRLFDPSTKFINVAYSTPDSTDNKFKVLTLFQDLMRFHIDNNENSELLDVDLKRLKWLNRNAELVDRSERYFDALTKLKNQFNEGIASLDIDLLLANYYIEQSYECHSLSNCKHPKALVNAKSIVDVVLKNKKYNNPITASVYNNFKELSQQIELKIMQVLIGKNHIPNEYIKAELSYRNLGDVAFEIRPISLEKYLSLPHHLGRNNDFNSLNLKSDPIKKWQVTLPDAKDYLTRKLVMKIDPLKAGIYVINWGEPNTSKSNFAIIQVSNMAYFEHSLTTGKKYIVVIDRQTGAPINDVEVTSYVANRYSEEPQAPKKIGNTKTDKNGIAYPKLDKNGYATLKLSKGEDVYYETNGVHRDYHGNYRTSDQTYFFMDRQIYRPGQILHFKGIAVHLDKDRMPKILKNKSVTITLRDVNYKEVKSLNLRTNSYGSFSGQFEVPSDRLLGRMSLTSDTGRGGSSFRVEEYKRPKFMVEIDELEGLYAVGDSIHLMGKALAYSGAAIDGAKVRYTVVRKQQRPRWCMWVYSYFPYNNTTQKILDHGELITKDDGSFDIPIYLEKEVNSRPNSWYNYEVQIAVIDLNGEQIEEQESIFARVQSLFLEANLSPSMKRLELKEVKLISKNNNGQEIATKINYELVSLIHPSGGDLHRSYRKQMDTSLYSREEFYRYFPNDVFGEDDNPDNWKLKENIKKGALSSGETVDFSDLKSGELYRIILTSVDQKDKEVKQIYHFEIQEFEGTEYPIISDSWLDINKQPYNVGDRTNIQMVMKGNPQNVFRYVTRSSNKIGVWGETQWNNNSIDIVEKDRGDLSIHWVAMKNNYLYRLRTPILIGWGNKDLDIELVTFRDKLQPGSKESWKIKIKGSKKELIAAELLASMYDESLDQFVNNQWHAPRLWPSNRLSSVVQYSNHNMATTFVRSLNGYPNYHLNVDWKKYPQLTRMRFGRNLRYRRSGMMDEMESDAVMVESSSPPEAGQFDSKRMKANTAGVTDNAEGLNGQKDKENNIASDVKFRSDLAETVFFYPHLETNKDGEIILSFTMKEALTKWRLQLLAHSSDLQMGMTQRSLVTQKELMVIPNTPRILRVDDEVWVTAKVINMTDKVQIGKVEFKWFDPSTNLEISDQLMDDIGSKSFNIEAKGSKVFKWKINITDDLPSVVKYKVVALGDKHSDGEENIIPVLQNKILLTSSMLMQVPRESTKTFSFDRYINAEKHQNNHRLSIQYLSHPSWLAIQALPYLNEPTNRSTDWIVDQLFANAISSQIANKNPRIKAVFDQWKQLESDALISQLEKNESLKSILLKETPWVIQGENETEQKKKIALLFDVNTMSQNMTRSVGKLKQRQHSDGGFGWFPGANRSSWYTTLRVVENLSFLKTLDVDLEEYNLKPIINKAILFLDKEMVRHYVQLIRNVKRANGKLENIHINEAMIKYFYVRSFHTDQPITKSSQMEYDYYLGQMKKYWDDFPFYVQAIAGFTFHQLEMNQDRDAIVASLKEHSHYKESLGRYWRGNGYNWYQSDVETQAKIMGLMRVVKTDDDYMDEMRLWLLKNKSANHWKSSSATVSAIYEILQDNSIIIDDASDVTLKVGDIIVSSNPDASIEKGTGLIQQTWSKKEMNKSLGKIKVENPSISTNWGAMYWQYFVPLDRVKSDNKLPISIQKQLFKVIITDRGESLVEVSENALHPGDKLVVRLNLRVDRAMGYVHLKDMRPSGMEPMQVLSGYEWKGGLSYYKTISDEAAHYYFEHLRPGTYVLENKAYVVYEGNFSIGPAILESLYAPEYRAHSQGGKIVVEGE